MKTKVFAHKGIIGITCIDIDPQECLNSPIEIMLGMGVVVDAKSIEFSKDALDILKTYKTGEDQIGDVGIFVDKNKTTAFGWQGGPNQVLLPDSTVGKISDVSLFDTLTVVENIEIPEGFIESIDEYLEMKQLEDRVN
jgi:hypothetical protein